MKTTNLILKRYLISGLCMLFIFLVSGSQLDAQVREGEYYYLQARHSGKYVQLSQKSKANGVVFNQWNKTGETTQQFQFKSVGGGYYQLVVRYSGKSLDVSQVSQQNGAQFHQWDYWNNDNQKFRLESAGSGYYFFRVKHSNKYLDVSQVSQSNGAVMHQWQKTGAGNQQFKIIPVSKPKPTGPSGPVTLAPANIKFGKYYYLQFKTSSQQHLRIGDNGVAGGSTVKDDRSKWLFIPTKIRGEYWIFNKGAREGFGEVLTLPKGQSNFGQWEFLNERRQIFSIGQGRLINKFNYEAVSTRHNNAAFTWKVNLSDDSQVFRLVEAEDVKCDDMLAAYSFWNLDNKVVQDYFAKVCQNGPKAQPMPGPQVLGVKKLVFVNNNSSGTITPAVHRFGCGGTPWRGYPDNEGKTLPQCWTKRIPAGENATFEISHYLQNSHAIWGVIIESTTAIIAVAATVASGGSAGPIAGTALQMGTLTTAGAITSTLIKNKDIDFGPSVGTLAGQTALSNSFPLLGDLAAFVWVAHDNANSVLGLDDGRVRIRYKEKVMDHFGVTSDISPDLNKVLGEYVFAVKGETYRDLMDQWYLHETESDKGYYSMFFSGGTAVLVSNDKD